MTDRDELRGKCIEAIGEELFHWRYENAIWDLRMNDNRIEVCLLVAITIFDALHGIARVVPPVATEEMLLARTAWESEDDAHATWRGMASVGDLTNAQKEKPWP